ncbi:precorrin-6A reductase [Lihuaxuella thermophila]|uniref:Precorrin-6A/cobalt-precorrin-6A reductase n=1 Tax=Lihuaxuella thermophila TaxID=1173111 RepID=A0A1H8DZ32_9BACL|nr:precorrin-6A reductase [Lihuaxuella thermophila]SEN12581.1 precorrin-6A/cobalt-precorrin-6A reductase [Lihuaxuella thermophila]
MLLFLAGTSDARELAIRLHRKKIPLLATVVTENAAKSLQEADIPVRVGRLTSQEMAGLIRERGFIQVVDASHPFAEEASRNAMDAAKTCGIPYIRYERPAWVYGNDPRIQVVSSYEEAAEEAARRKGVVMLTTGSKTLHIFANRLLNDPDIRLVARMLPRRENMEKCAQLGIGQKNIVAMQGPFSKELNAALYRHYGVTTVVTKESGKIGSVDEKVEAALHLGIDVILIARPRLEYGTSFSSMEEVVAAVCEWRRNEHGRSTV